MILNGRYTSDDIGFNPFGDCATSPIEIIEPILLRPSVEINRDGIESILIIPKPGLIDIVECKSLTEFAVAILKMGGENVARIKIKCRDDFFCPKDEPPLCEVIRRVNEDIEPSEELLSFLRGLKEGD